MILPDTVNKNEYRSKRLARRSCLTGPTVLPIMNTGSSTTFKSVQGFTLDLVVW